MYIGSNNITMTSLSVSATYARNNFFELLDKVSSGLVDVVIKKDNKEVAFFLPIKKGGTNINALTKAVDDLKPYFKNYKLSDSPLRRPGASDFLGRWDKAL